MLRLGLPGCFRSSGHASGAGTGLIARHSLLPVWRRFAPTQHHRPEGFHHAMGPQCPVPTVPQAQPTSWAGVFRFMRLPSGCPPTFVGACHSLDDCPPAPPLVTTHTLAASWAVVWVRAMHLFGLLIPLLPKPRLPPPPPPLIIPVPSRCMSPAVPPNTPWTPKYQPMADHVAEFQFVLECYKGWVLTPILPLSSPIPPILPPLLRCCGIPEKLFKCMIAIITLKPCRKCCCNSKSKGSGRHVAEEKGAKGDP